MPFLADEHLRPEFHHTPPAGWMNDPNGLVVVDGRWHLFFQANPATPDWGEIAWGHAVSRDLVNWEPQPVALVPYPAREPGAVTLVFSGSVVERDGGELWAYYTAHERRGDLPLNESVALARSADGGRTWARHPGGPVIDRGQVDFRDPKAFRHEPSGAWVLVIAGAAERCVLVYRSADGVAWEEASAFTDPAERSWLWECPDLFEVPVRGADTTRWVLVVSGAHPAGRPFTGMTYWVGYFDGLCFTADSAGARPLEHGRDFFAGVTYNGLPAGAEPVMVGWASNWAYAKSTPTPGWRGAMALPRRLWLEPDDPTGVLMLCQAPAEPIEAFLASPSSSSSRSVAPARNLQHEAPQIALDGEVLLAAEIRFEVAVGGGPRWVRLVVGPEEWLEIGADADAGRVWADRRHGGGGGPEPFHPAFPSLDEALLPAGAGSAAPVDVRAIVDHSIVEVFAAGGRAVLTELWFPSGPWHVEASPGTAAVLRSLSRTERSSGS